MIVTTTAQLLAALSAASKMTAAALAAYTISLAPGNYAGVKILSDNPAAVVTINSADPAHPAVILGYLGIANSSNLKFSNLEMSIVGSTDPYYAFRMQGLKTVSFDQVNVHGDPAVSATKQLTALYVTDSTNISFTNSTFAHVGAGLSALRITNLIVDHNRFSEVNKGGVEAGAITTGAITNNVFSDFQVSPGTHPDAIQVFTSGTTTPSSNLTITGNRIERAQGDAMQGIFVQDETGVLPFNGITIDGNQVLGCMWDCIYLSEAKATGKIEIVGNTALSWPGLDMEGGGNAAQAALTPKVVGFAGWLWLRGDFSGASSVTVTGNVAQSYPAGMPAGNLLMPGLTTPPPAIP